MTGKAAEYLAAVGNEAAEGLSAWTAWLLNKAAPAQRIAVKINTLLVKGFLLLPNCILVASQHMEFPDGNYIVSSKMKMVISKKVKTPSAELNNSFAGFKRNIK